MNAPTATATSTALFKNAQMPMISISIVVFFIFYVLCFVYLFVSNTAVLSFSLLLILHIILGGLYGFIKFTIKPATSNVKDGNTGTLFMSSFYVAWFFLLLAISYFLDTARRLKAFFKSSNLGIITEGMDFYRFRLFFVMTTVLLWLFFPIFRIFGFKWGDIFCGKNQPLNGNIFSVQNTKILYWAICAFLIVSSVMAFYYAYHIFANQHFI
jgi:hypothetical protein